MMFSSISDDLPAAQETGHPCNGSTHARPARAMSWAMELPGTRQAVSVARQWAKQIVEGSAHLDTVELIVSELVTNAVIHSASGDDGRVRIRLEVAGDGVRISVIDEGPAATPGVRGDADDGGRGLLIVDALAVDCGVVVTGYARRTWALVA